MQLLHVPPSITRAPSHTIRPTLLSPSSRSISTSLETLMTTFFGGTDILEKPADDKEQD